MLRIFLSIILFLFLVPPITGQTQDEIILQLSVSENLETSLSVRRIINEFEALNPGIHVQLVSNGNRIIFPPESTDDLAQYIDEVAWAASQGDVIAINSSWLLPEATQAGYFLDLAPLTTVDTSLNSDDFFQPAWESFQWDNGLWALPISYEFIFLLYNSEVFDSANLSYPNGSWTATEFENAASTLTQIEGIPALSLQSEGAVGFFLRSLIDTKTTDDASIPSTPHFDDEQLDDVIGMLQQMQSDGLLIPPSRPGLSMSNSPMMVGGLNLMRFGLDSKIKAALLPGEQTGLRVQGFGVSRGTSYPEEAYLLAKFLTSQLEFANQYGSMPAQLNLLPSGFETLEEVSNVLAVPEGIIPNPELRFINYLVPLIKPQGEAPPDIAVTLYDIQTSVAAELGTLYAQRDAITVVIPVPDSMSIVPSDRQIHFNVVSSVTPVPTRYLWERLAGEFAEQDAQIELVNMTFNSSILSRITETSDCFYSPYDVVSNDDLSLLRNLDPLLASDPNFDSSDFVGDVLAKVSRNDKIWAMPLTMEPNVLWYSELLFEEAGVPVPKNDWTISDFTAALGDLSSVDNPRVLTSYHFLFDSSYLLMLIAAYGGLPFDYRVDPPTVDFTDANTVAAIRQVLDLAKSGTMTYSQVSSIGAFGGGGISALMLTALDDSNNRDGKLVTRVSNQGRPFHLLNYPQGLDYVPVSYSIGGAYISVNTTNIENCYRFISFISQHPELFVSMPVRLSQINSPEVIASRPAETISFYNALVERMQLPNAVELPADTFMLVWGNFPLYFWLNRAFDRYVLEDADLEMELAEAEVKTLEFLECVDNIEQANDISSYDRQTYDCAVSVEPEIANR